MSLSAAFFRRAPPLPRFWILALCLIGTVTAIDFRIITGTGINGSFSGWGSELYGIVLITVIWLYARWARLNRFIELCPLAIFSIIANHVLSLLIQCAARSGAPLCDFALSRIDRLMGFSTITVVKGMAHFSVLKTILGVVYASAGLVIAAAVIVPALCGQIAASRRYVVSMILAAIVTAGVFAMVPAAGPWTVQGYSPDRIQLGAQNYLIRLKTPGPITLDFANAGIVSFPSFHVALALLAMGALWSVRPLRGATLTLTILTCVATITTGWHYLIDVFGGIAVGALSWKMSSLLSD